MAPALSFLLALTLVVGACAWGQPPPKEPNSTAFGNITCEGDGGVTGLRVYAYLNTCSGAEIVVLSWVTKAVSDDPGMAASLLRLHFHDCFVNGCDASMLLDDTPDLEGEKGAAPKLNSLRGFEVIDAIKSDLEAVFPGTVSCADILAMAARDSVMLGPVWEVETGRRDGRIASKAAANANIPAPKATFETLATMFQNIGLNLTEMVALSGAHTVGKARCSSFSSRLRDSSPDANADFLQSLNQLCSLQAADESCSTAATLAELDLVTPTTLDNQYYINLLSGEGLLASDQVLVTTDAMTRDIAALYAQNQNAFFGDFTGSMLKMGRLGALTGRDGEVRRNCRTIN